MKRTLTILLLLLCGAISFAQENRIPTILRSSKSYLIADFANQDTAFLKKKCRQAGLEWGISVIANRIPTDSKFVLPKPSEHLLKQGILHLQLPMDEQQNEFAVYHSELFDIPSSINVLQVEDELITYRTMETTGNIHLLYHCVRACPKVCIWGCLCCGLWLLCRMRHARNGIVDGCCPWFPWYGR